MNKSLKIFFLINSSISGKALFFEDSQTSGKRKIQFKKIMEHWWNDIDSGTRT